MKLGGDELFIPGLSHGDRLLLTGNNTKPAPHAFFFVDFADTRIEADGIEKTTIGTNLTGGAEISIHNGGKTAGRREI